MLLRFIVFVLLWCNGCALFGQPLFEVADTLVNNKRYYGYKRANAYVLAPRFEEAHSFRNDRALVKQGGYYRFIDAKGNQVGNVHFVQARSFSEGLAAAKFADGWGYVNTHLQTVIPAQYEEALSFSESMAGVKKNKWFFVNKKNSQTFMAEYDSVVSSFKNGIALVGMNKEGWKFGAVNKTGNWVIPCVYRQIERLSDFLVLAENTPHDYLLFNTQGKALVKEMEYLNEVSDTLFLYEKEALQYLVNAKGEPKNKVGLKAWKDGEMHYFQKWFLVDTTFKKGVVVEADSFVSVGGTVFRCLNNKRQVAFPTPRGGYFEEVRGLAGKHFRVSQYGKWGLADSEGIKAVPCVYDSLSVMGPFTQTHVGKRVGLLDHQGRLALKVAYDGLRVSNASNRIYFHVDHRAGYMQLDDTTVFKIGEFDSLTEVRPHLLLAWKGDSSALVNPTWERLFPRAIKGICYESDTLMTAYDKDSLYRGNLLKGQWCTRRIPILRRLNDTLAWASISDTLKGVFHFKADSLVRLEADTLWQHPNLATRLLTRKGPFLGFASLDGRLLGTYFQAYQSIGEEKNGFLKVIARKRMGFMDTNGYLLIATQYDSVGMVSEGHASVKFKTKWGFVNRKEALVVQPHYTQVGQFMQGLANVWLGGLATLVNTQGVELFKPRYQGLYPLKMGYWLTHKGRNYGLMDKEGKEVLTPWFEKIQETPIGYLLLRQYGKEGVMSRDLQIKLPLAEKEVKWIKGSYLFAIKAD